MGRAVSECAPLLGIADRLGEGTAARDDDRRTGAVGQDREP